jgi:drug/metabolite transporter (DMT)-like permease
MLHRRVFALTLLAMLAFAGNSLLCRAALRDTGLDAASFTTLRLASGALALWLLTRRRGGGRSGKGNWLSALALFAYAAVQATMIGYGIWNGERLRSLQLVGLVLALAGLVGLLLPGISAPPLVAAVLMLGAGAAWGIYSLRGKGAGDPTMVTAGNFLRAVPVAVILSVLMYRHASVDVAGLGYALASGALTSGLGYAIWYMALPALRTTSAATVQLSVPVIAALGGVVLLGESLNLRLVLASAAILGGIALVIFEKAQVARTSATAP